MTPVTFQGCFGWLHPAAGKRGAVLCGTFGIEDLAAHREWRALAQMPGIAGFYGASSAERLPIERAITAQIKAFKALKPG